MTKHPPASDNPEPVRDVSPSVALLLPTSGPSRSPRERPERKPAVSHLANQLAKMIENLDAYISERAFKMASVRIAEVETAAQARIAEVERDAEIQAQQLRGVIAEIRRVIAVGRRRADRLQAQVNRAREIDEDSTNHGFAPEHRLAALLRDMPPAGRLSDYTTEGNAQ